MDIEIVEDIKNFWQLIGACNILNEKSIMSYNEIMDEDYKSIIKKLSEKYNVPFIQDYDFPENYLDVEEKLANKFDDMLLKNNI